MASFILRWFDGANETGLQKNPIIAGHLVSITFAYLLFLYFYNGSTFYNPIGWIDPYKYVGYGLYYSYPDFRDDYYKASRLPWDLVEFAARHIFRPEIASFLLQFSSFSLMSICVFFYFRGLIGSWNARLLAVVAVFFPLFYAVGGADYHNAISGPLYFLTLGPASRSDCRPVAAVRRTRRRRSRSNGAHQSIPDIA